VLNRRSRPKARAARGTWGMLVVLILTTGLSHPAAAQAELDYWQVLAMDRAAFRIRDIALMPLGDGPGQQMVYGDRYGIVRVVEMTGGDVREVWRSRPLEGAVLEVRVEDLDGNGSVEIIALTRGGRLYVYDDKFNARWENLREDYNEIVAMDIANMDSDPAYEFVILSDEGYIDYVDGNQFNREFRSTQTFQATQLIVGNVDNDPDLEIVLNSGVVIDAVLADAQWSTDEFGSQIELLDIDGDGIEEILGYTPASPSQNMRIFEADLQQEKPLR
jgi:hypothetical protein